MIKEKVLGGSSLKKVLLLSVKKAMYTSSPSIPGEPRAWNLRVGREEMPEEVVIAKLESA